MNVKNKNRPGYKKTQLGWLPQGWSFSPLGEVLESSKYGCNAPSAENGNTPVVGMKDIRDGRLVLSNLARVNLTEGDQSRFLLEPGDVLINRTNSYDLVGKVGIFDSSDKVAFVSYLVRLRGQREMLNQQFLSFWLNSFAGRKSIKRIATKGVSQANVNPTELRKQCRLALPPLPEQEAIAGVLECWDRAIRAYEKKIEKKRNVKKGLMQALLSGKIRLPGFGTTENTEGHGKGRGGIPEGWKEVRLRKLCSLSKKKYQPNEQEDLKCLELEHIEKGTGRIIGYTSSSAQSSMKTRFKPGSILFGKLRPYLQKFARPQFAGVCSTEIWALLPNEREVSGDFLFWLVQSGRFNAAANVTSGSKMPRADWRHLSSCVFLLPTICEQQGMASLLSAADAEISTLERKLVVLKDQKRFLLNNLVTGTIRLPEFCNHGTYGIARKWEA